MVDLLVEKALEIAESVIGRFGRKRAGVVRECLRAAVDGPSFPDWEFGTIFGLERDDVRKVLLSWPELNETNDSVVQAINNSLNNLLGYPTRNKEEIWPQLHFRYSHGACKNFRQVEG